MFDTDFYTEQKRRIDAEIKRNLRIAQLAYSSSEACRKKAKQAEKALEKLRRQLDGIMQAEKADLELWNSEY